MATLTQAQRSSAIPVSLRRIIGLMGIVGILLFFVGVFGIQGDAPGLADPVSEVRTWYADNGQQYLVGDYISGIALLVFLVPFFVGLYGILAHAEGSEPVGSRVALGGFLLFLTFVATSSVSTNALALGAEQIDSDGTIRALQYLEFAAFSGMVPLGIVLLIGGASYVIAKTKVMWSWLSWLGIAVSAAGVIGAAALIDGDPEGPLAGIGLAAIAGTMLWMLAAAINLFVSKPVDNR